LNAVNYKIDMGRHETVLRIHVLNKWEEGSKPINLMITDEGLQDDEKPFWKKLDDCDDTNQFSIGSQFKPHLASEMKQ
jgi:hypothetical protein